MVHSGPIQLLWGKYGLMVHTLRENPERRKIQMPVHSNPESNEQLQRQGLGNLMWGHQIRT